MATTRLSLNGYGTRPVGSFAGRVPAGHPVGVITRLTLNGYAGKRTGDFSGREAVGGHPVGIITRFGLNGFMVERTGSFSGKTLSIPVTGNKYIGFINNIGRMINRG